MYKVKWIQETHVKVNVNTVIEVTMMLCYITPVNHINSYPSIHVKVLEQVPMCSTEDKIKKRFLNAGDRSLENQFSCVQSEISLSFVALLAHPGAASRPACFAIVNVLLLQRRNFGNCGGEKGKLFLHLAIAARRSGRHIL